MREIPDCKMESIKTCVEAGIVIARAISKKVVFGEDFDSLRTIRPGVETGTLEKYQDVRKKTSFLIFFVMCAGKSIKKRKLSGRILILSQLPGRAPIGIEL